MESAAKSQTLSVAALYQDQDRAALKQQARDTLNSVTKWLMRFKMSLACCLRAALS